MGDQAVVLYYSIRKEKNCTVEYFEMNIKRTSNRAWNNTVSKHKHGKVLKKIIIFKKKKPFYNIQY